MSWSAYNKRIKELKTEPSTDGRQYVGRIYTELTDTEKECYLDYLYGANRNFTHEAVEMVETGINGTLKGIICKKRARNPLKPMTKNEIAERAQEIKKFIEREQNK